MRCVVYVCALASCYPIAAVVYRFKICIFLTVGATAAATATTAGRGAGVGIALVGGHAAAGRGAARGGAPGPVVLWHGLYPVAVERPFLCCVIQHGARVENTSLGL